MLDEESTEEEIKARMVERGLPRGYSDQVHEYLSERVPPDDIVILAMLANDLFDTLFFIKEDYVAQQMSGEMWKWMEFFQEELPPECWGNWDTVIEWAGGDNEEVSGPSFLLSALADRDERKSRCLQCGSPDIEWLSFSEFSRRCTDKGVTPKCRHTVSDRVKRGRYVSNEENRVSWCEECEEITPDTEAENE